MQKVPLAVDHMAAIKGSEGALCPANIREPSGVEEPIVPVRGGGLVSAEPGGGVGGPSHLHIAGPCRVGDDVEGPPAVVPPFALSACRAS